MGSIYSDWGRQDEIRVRKMLYQRPIVRKAIKDSTKRLALRAEAVLAASRDQGHSEIITRFGWADGYVELNDEAGENRAHLIEFGDGAPAPLSTAVAVTRSKNYGKG